MALPWRFLRILLVDNLSQLNRTHTFDYFYVSQQMSAPIYGMDIFFIIKYFEMAFFAAENEH